MAFIKIPLTVNLDGEPLQAALADIRDAIADLQESAAEQGEAMSALTDAVANLKSRVNEDVDHLKSLLEEALATETSNEAEIQRLRDEAASVGAEVDAAIADINSFDPDPSNPAAPAPADEG